MSSIIDKDNNALMSLCDRVFVHDVLQQFSSISIPSSDSKSIDNADDAMNVDETPKKDSIESSNVETSIKIFSSDSTLNESLQYLSQSSVFALRCNDAIIHLIDICSYVVSNTNDSEKSLELDVDIKLKHTLQHLIDWKPSSHLVCISSNSSIADTMVFFASDFVSDFLVSSPDTEGSRLSASNLANANQCISTSHMAFTLLERIKLLPENDNVRQLLRRPLQSICSSSWNLVDRARAQKASIHTPTSFRDAIVKLARAGPSAALAVLDSSSDDAQSTSDKLQVLEVFSAFSLASFSATNIITSLSNANLSILDALREFQGTSSMNQLESNHLTPTSSVGETLNKFANSNGDSSMLFVLNSNACTVGTLSLAQFFSHIHSFRAGPE